MELSSAYLITAHCSSPPPVHHPLYTAEALVCGPCTCMYANRVAVGCGSSVHTGYLTVVEGSLYVRIIVS